MATTGEVRFTSNTSSNGRVVQQSSSNYQQSSSSSYQQGGGTVMRTSTRVSGGGGGGGGGSSSQQRVVRTVVNSSSSGGGGAARSRGAGAASASQGRIVRSVQAGARQASGRRSSRNNIGARAQHSARMAAGRAVSHSPAYAHEAPRNMVIVRDVEGAKSSVVRRSRSEMQRTGSAAKLIRSNSRGRTLRNSQGARVTTKSQVVLSGAKRVAKGSQGPGYYTDSHGNAVAGNREGYAWVSTGAGNAGYFQSTHGVHHDVAIGDGTHPLRHIDSNARVVAGTANVRYYSEDSAVNASSGAAESRNIVRTTALASSGAVNAVASGDNADYYVVKRGGTKSNSSMAIRQASTTQAARSQSKAVVTRAAMECDVHEEARRDSMLNIGPHPDITKCICQICTCGCVSWSTCAAIVGMAHPFTDLCAAFLLQLPQMPPQQEEDHRELQVRGHVRGPARVHREACRPPPDDPP